MAAIAWNFHSRYNGCSDLCSALYQQQSC